MHACRKGAFGLDDLRPKANVGKSFMQTIDRFYFLGELKNHAAANYTYSLDPN
jgi:hypothetical protein